MLSLTELGKRLEEARKQKNLTLDELQSITKIQKRYLKAIEEGNYGILPGKFYARAFIRQYAEAVGLDSERIFDEFVSDIPKSEVEAPSGLSSRTQTKRTPVSSTSSVLFAILPKLLVFVLVVSVAVFIWLYMQKLDIAKNTDNDSVNTVESQTDENITIVNQDDEEGTENPNEETNTNDQQTETPNDNAPTQEQPTEEDDQQLLELEKLDGRTPYTTYELKGTDQFIVELSSTGRSYIGIINGIGKSFYGGELGNGEKLNYDFSAEEEIEFNIGRTLDVQLKINGQPVNYPFPPTEKVHQKVKIIFNKVTQ
ncbi:helix-turn-helix domain-containing protein [Calidifontibacillus oryziterrae]|uniref:helix-turn-helix domain-containing protein n=1 Tax=Calidifontibacillus oryziterrae TaxID=1191699 RepID=UPI0012B657C2|nr:RodZ domain-containing protein [Calidifontibacillus oryziterrae]